MSHLNETPIADPVAGTDENRIGIRDSARPSTPLVEDHAPIDDSSDDHSPASPDSDDFGYRGRFSFRPEEKDDAKAKLEKLEKLYETMCETFKKEREEKESQTKEYRELAITVAKGILTSDEMFPKPTEKNFEKSRNACWLYDRLNTLLLKVMTSDKTLEFPQVCFTIGAAYLKDRAEDGRLQIETLAEKVVSRLESMSDYPVVPIAEWDLAKYQKEYARFQEYATSFEATFVKEIGSTNLDLTDASKFVGFKFALEELDNRIQDLKQKERTARRRARRDQKRTQLALAPTLSRTLAERSALGS